MGEEEGERVSGKVRKREIESKRVGEEGRKRESRTQDREKEREEEIESEENKVRQKPKDGDRGKQGE